MPVAQESSGYHSWTMADRIRLIRRLIETKHDYDTLATEFGRTPGNLKAVVTNMRKQKDADGNQVFPIPFSPKGKGRPKAVNTMTEDDKAAIRKACGK